MSGMERARYNVERGKLVKVEDPDEPAALEIPPGSDVIVKGVTYEATSEGELIEVKRRS